MGWSPKNKKQGWSTRQIQNGKAGPPAYSNTYYAYQSYETLPGGYSLRFGLATNCAARCTEPALYSLSDDYLNHKQYIHDQTPWLEYGSGTSDYLCLKVHPYVEEVDTGGTCSDQRGSPTIIPH